MSLGPLMIDVAGTSLTQAERKRLRSPLVGGVILFARNFATRPELEALVADIHGVRHPPLLVAVDQEGGRVQRFREPFFLLPPVRALGRAYDRNASEGATLAELFGWVMAAELRAVGVDLSFAPVVDLDLGQAAVIGNRALHGNPEVVAILARKLMAGAKRAGMAATAKHFPSHAGVRSDSHTELACDARERSALQADIDVYRKLIGTGLPAIMVAHVAFPQLDPLPASLSRWWVTSELREGLGFHGVIVSDDLSMAGAGVVGVPRRALATPSAQVAILFCFATRQRPLARCWRHSKVMWIPWRSCAWCACMVVRHRVGTPCMVPRRGARHAPCWARWKNSSTPSDSGMRAMAGWPVCDLGPRHGPANLPTIET